MAQVKSRENSLTTKLLVTSYSCPAKKEKKLHFPVEIEEAKKGPYRRKYNSHQGKDTDLGLDAQCSRPI